MAEQGIAAGTDTSTSGRPALAPLFTSADLVSAQLADCYRKSGADVVTDTERAALAQLTALTNACLVGEAAEPVVTVLQGFAWKPIRQARLDPGQPQDCINQSRRKQLASYVAPRAYLYVAGPARQAGTVLDLSRAGTSRVATVAGLVLAVAFAITLLVGLRISRPLRALTHAVESGASDLPVRGRDEIGRLTTAFNDLSQRRESVELYRKGNREDRAAAEEAEIAVIGRFLPAQLSEEEAQAKIREIVAETGASSMKDMGRVMALVKERLGAAIEPARASALVKAALSA